MLQGCSYSLHLSLGLQMCITRPGFMCGSWELNSGSYTKVLMITQVIGTLPADLSSHIWSESMFKVLPLPVGICFPLALQCILLQCSWVCFYFVIIYWQCLLSELWHFLSWHLCWTVNLCRYGRTGSRNMQASQCPIILAAVAVTAVSITIDPELGSPFLHTRYPTRHHLQITKSKWNCEDVQDSKNKMAK